MSKLVEELKILGAQGKTYEEAALIVGKRQGNIRWICWRYGIPMNKSDKTGIKNPNYKGGTSKSHIWRTAKRVVVESGRSLLVCERCQYTAVSDLPIHHKNRNRKDNSKINLEVLCVPCHSKEHRFRRLEKVLPLETVNTLIRSS